MFSCHPRFDFVPGVYPELVEGVTPLPGKTEVTVTLKVTITFMALHSWHNENQLRKGDREGSHADSKKAR
jgi:hypothetical protein